MLLHVNFGWNLTSFNNRIRSKIYFPSPPRTSFCSTLPLMVRILSLNLRIDPAKLDSLTSKKRLLVYVLRVIVYCNMSLTCTYFWPCYMLHVKTVSYLRFNDMLLYFHMEHWSLLKPPFVLIHIIGDDGTRVFGSEVYQWFLLGGSWWLIPLTK